METPDVSAVIKHIGEAFAHVERPGDWALVDSTEGDEPALLRQELTGRGDWRSLDVAFLDQLPAGYGSALSFFSDEAFRHFLPAYLIGDLEGRLRQAEPVFHLVHGLDAESAHEPINKRRYGARTWSDAAHYKFSTFTSDEAKAVVAYLEYMATRDEFNRPRIEQALASFWRRKAADMK
jgi:hypothetical protein